MLQKKQGFTLIEVLVVMLIATIVFAMVAGTMVFITTTTDELIQKAEEIDMAKNIEKYFRNLAQQTDSDDYLITDKDGSVIVLNDNGDITNGDTTVFASTNLEILKIYETDDHAFIKCYLKFQSGRMFEFILDYIR